MDLLNTPSIEDQREEIFQDVIQQHSYIEDLPLSDDTKHAIISDIVDQIIAIRSATI
jgi:hypothetical protein